MIDADAAGESNQLIYGISLFMVNAVFVFFLFADILIQLRGVYAEIQTITLCVYLLLFWLTKKNITQNHKTTKLIYFTLIIY